MANKHVANKLVFVYGTLKRGQPNHDWLTRPTNGSAVFRGRASTSDAFPLVVASRYNIPFLLDAPGRGHCVSGELYEVDDAMMVKLDELELHPDVYLRQMKQVIPEPSSEVAGASESVAAHVYLLQGFQENLLELPTHTCYDAELIEPRYVTRDKRDPEGPCFAVDVLLKWPK